MLVPWVQPHMCSGLLTDGPSLSDLFRLAHGYEPPSCLLLSGGGMRHENVASHARNTRMSPVSIDACQHIEQRDWFAGRTATTAQGEDPAARVWDQR